MESTQTGQLVINADGSLEVRDPETRRRIADRAGRYRLLVDVPGLVVLREERQRHGASQPIRVVMAGEIVHRMTVMEVINVIASSNWKGELHILADEIRRTLSFDQGGLRHAHSSHPEDRLGEVLFRMGLVGRQQLQDLLSEVSEEQRLGKLLLDEGLVDAQTLFQALQRQAQQIFGNALLVDAGSYLFVLPDEARQPPAATVHIPVQALLMEGVQRIDEMQLFRERIPSSQMYPERVRSAETKPIDEVTDKVRALCNGNRTIEQIAMESGLEEFATTKAVYQLLRLNQVVLRAGGTTVDQAAVRRLVARFNEIMQDIFIAVATYGKVQKTRNTLAGWIEDSGYAPMFGEGVNEDGSVELERILDALSSSDHDRPLEELHQALHELGAFALFAATTSLPRQQERDLALDTTRRLHLLSV